MKRAYERSEAHHYPYKFNRLKSFDQQPTYHNSRKSQEYIRKKGLASTLFYSSYICIILITTNISN